MELGFGEKILLLMLILCACALYLPTNYAASAVILAMAVLILQQYRTITQWKGRGIGGPPPNFIFGNLLQILRGRMEFDLSNRSYGPIYGIYLFGKPVLIITDPDMLKEILIKDFSNFMNREKPPFFQGKSNILNYMLLTLPDKRWKEVRNIVSPCFTTGKLKLIFPIICECIELCKQVTLETSKHGECDFAARKIVGALIMDIIAKAGFGMEISIQSQTESHFMKMANKLFDFSFFDPALILIILFPKISQIISNIFNRQLHNNDVNTYFIKVIKQMVDEKLKVPETDGRQDFLRMLLSDSVLSDGDSESAANNKNRDKTKLSEMETLAQCFIFLAAGYETTTTTLEFALYSLAVNPAIQKKAYEEACGIIGNQRDLDYEKISQLSYINKVIMETLRMYPPITSIVRECHSDTSINGFYIPKGQVVHVPLLALHYDEEFYDDPLVFNPERFENDKVVFNNLMYMPFGNGPRNCIGMRFAIIEMKAILASLLMEFEFTAPNYAQYSNMKMNTTGFTKPAEKITLHVKQRS